jgi:hypothetical protein
VPTIDDRQREAGDDRRRHVAQEQEDHQDDEAERQQQRELTSRTDSRMVRAVEEDVM